MTQSYPANKNRKIKKLLNESFESLMTIIQKHNPNAKALIENNNHSVFHDLISLLIIHRIATRDYIYKPDGRLAEWELRMIRGNYKANKLFPGEPLISDLTLNIVYNWNSPNWFY